MLILDLLLFSCSPLLTETQKYGNLYEMIRELVLRSGVRIEYNRAVVDVDVEGPSVLLKDGELIEADMIVGADGTYSLVREKVVGYKERHSVGPYSTYS